MPDISPKILFLAAHVQPFLLAGIKMLIQKYDARVLVVCRPVPDNAPIELPDHQNLSFIFKEDNSQEIATRIFDFNADVVWAAGWMDKDYLKWAKRYKNMGKPTVMAMDTQWKGKTRQYINSLIAPFFIRSIYTHCWAPGYLQLQYARKLGFDEAHLLSGLLTPDTILFGEVYNNTRASKEADYPKAFLYVGRLEPHKFENLLKAFTMLDKESRNGWKLIVAGSGSMEGHPAMQDADVVYKGFQSQADLAATIAESGVFCLTSSEEPWGTVVQEAAAAGMPLLVSKQCGSHYSMLQSGVNGFLCDGNSVTDIQEKIKQFIELPARQLRVMGAESHRIATDTNPGTWADTLMSTINKN